MSEIKTYPEVQTRVTRVTVARLHNIGNYEHVRFEVSAEIAPGDSAAETIVGLERLLEAMDPRDKPTASEIDIRNRKAQWEDLMAMSEEDFRRRHPLGSFEGTRLEYLNRVKAGILESEEKLALWNAKQAKARQLFDNLAGAAVWTDHKLDWEDSW